jgi:hypothetical protein
MTVILTGRQRQILLWDQAIGGDTDKRQRLRALQGWELAAIELTRQRVHGSMISIALDLVNTVSTD